VSDPTNTRPAELKLLACPFCGSSPTLWNATDPSDGFVFGTTIECQTCAVSVNDEYQDAAITAWNARSGDSGMGDGWLQIESAPRDGTQIIGFCGGDVNVCSWEPLDTPLSQHWGIAGTWHRRHISSGKNLTGGSFRPTHWIPLPPPPTTAASQGGEG
jgi:Lar family restriction alleviation protein